MRFSSAPLTLPDPASKAKNPKHGHLCRKSIAAFSGFTLLAGLAGCGGNVSVANDGGTPTPTPIPVADYPFLTGNWVFQTVATSGPTPFSTLSGFINETNQQPGIYDLTTVVLQSSPATTCYSGNATIPLQGQVKNTAFFVSSFSVNGQYLYITATKDATASHLTGTYLITQGCAAEAKGTINGTKYASLTGTYAGSIAGTSPAQKMQVVLTQAAQGTGDGFFYLSGSATFQGPSCFTKGTLSGLQSTVLGNTALLTITADDGSQVVAQGTFDVAAQTLSLTSVQVLGGSCAGQLGAATLAKQ